MEVTQLTVNHLEQLFELRKQFVKEKFIHYFSRAILQEGLENKEIYGIFADGALVAYVWYRNLKRKPITRLDEICSSLKGMGSRLLAYVEANATQPVIELNVVDFNTNAISFYTHKGYTQVSKKVGEKITQIVMRKELSGGLF